MEVELEIEREKIYEELEIAESVKAFKVLIEEGQEDDLEEHFELKKIEESTKIFTAEMSEGTIYENSAQSNVIVPLSTARKQEDEHWMDLAEAWQHHLWTPPPK